MRDTDSEQPIPPATLQEIIDDSAQIMEISLRLHRQTSRIRLWNKIADATFKELSMHSNDQSFARFLEHRIPAKYLALQGLWNAKRGKTRHVQSHEEKADRTTRQASAMEGRKDRAKRKSCNETNSNFVCSACPNPSRIEFRARIEFNWKSVHLWEQSYQLRSALLTS